MSLDRMLYAPKGLCTNGETAELFSRLDQGDPEPLLIQEALQICEQCPVACEDSAYRISQALGGRGLHVTVINSEVVRPPVRKSETPVLSPDTIIPVKSQRRLPRTFLNAFIAAGPDDYMTPIRNFNQSPETGKLGTSSSVNTQIFHEQLEASGFERTLPEGIIRPEIPHLTRNAIGLFCYVREAMHNDKAVSWDPCFGSEMPILTSLAKQYFSDVAGIRATGLHAPSKKACHYGSKEAAELVQFAKTAPGLSLSVANFLLSSHQDPMSRLKLYTKWYTTLHTRYPSVTDAEVTATLRATFKQNDFATCEQQLLLRTSTRHLRGQQR